MSDSNWIHEVVIGGITLLFSALGVTQHRRICKLEDEKMSKEAFEAHKEDISNQLAAIHESLKRNEKISMTIFDNVSRRAVDKKTVDE